MTTYTHAALLADLARVGARQERIRSALTILVPVLRLMDDRPCGEICGDRKSSGLLCPQCKREAARLLHGGK